MGVFQAISNQSMTTPGNSGTPSIHLTIYGEFVGQDHGNHAGFADKYWTSAPEYSPYPGAGYKFRFTKTGSDWSHFDLGGQSDGVWYQYGGDWNPAPKAGTSANTYHISALLEICAVNDATETPLTSATVTMAITVV